MNDPQTDILVALGEIKADLKNIVSTMSELKAEQANFRKHMSDMTEIQTLVRQHENTITEVRARLLGTALTAVLTALGFVGSLLWKLKLP